VLLLVTASLLIIIAINIFLWKSGFLAQAEKPEAVIDRPVMDARERKAVMKRLKRWREEGKLTRQEFETFHRLCEGEWDPS
jgi:hypothetical protein